MEKHGLDYRKFYTKLELSSKKQAADVARKLSKQTGMKWRCFSKSTNGQYKFETMIITNRKKRRELKDKIIEIEI